MSNEYPPRSYAVYVERATGLTYHAAKTHWRKQKDLESDEFTDWVEYEPDTNTSVLEPS